jgi:predicted secreted hydrolase
MIFQIRTKDGARDQFSSGTWISSDGSTRKIDLADFTLEPVEWWTSPKTKGRYPVAWKISIPSLKLLLTSRARFSEQELAAEPFSYWEGAIAAEGQLANSPIQGKGYLEMTGYAGGIVGMQAK